VPVRSYANGIWCGQIPPELQGLTFMEEQCIARARATRCMFKLEAGPSGQSASRGNACIFAQDPSPLLTSLPPPLSVLADEICVVFVGSPNAEVTLETLRKTPLLVRRQRILDALRWLMANNPLYHDLCMEDVIENLEEYPE
ncbi:hypothetical protein K523DRAFT_219239, partial [Schizophyllum commune Tattone D]